MKVLKDNYSTTEYVEQTNKIVCGDCESELEFDKSDVEIGVSGCAYVKCPLCKHDNFLGDYRIDGFDLELTVDNLEFPKHFYRFSKASGAVEITDKEVEKRIHEAIKHLRYNDEQDYYVTSSGDTMVLVLRLDGDESYFVSVSKDHYNVDIPYEPIDYRD